MLRLWIIWINDQRQATAPDLVIRALIRYNIAKEDDMSHGVFEDAPLLDSSD